MPKGGLRTMAKKVTGAGRNGDTVVVHLSPEEFNHLQSRWGKPTINPDTGLPEYFKLGKIFKSLLPIAGAVAAPILAPSLGSFLLPSGSSAFQNLLGSALVGGGLGALTGGKSGALQGAILGGGASALSPLLQNIFAGASPELSSSLGVEGGKSTVFGEGTGGDWIGTPAISRNIGRSTTLPALPGIPDSVAGDEAAGGAAPSAGDSPPSKDTPSWLGRNWPWLAGGAVALGALGGGRAPQSAASVSQLPAGPSLSTTNLPRQTAVLDPQDWYTYGRRPEVMYFSDNRLPSLSHGGMIPARARGGLPPARSGAYVPLQGGGGQDDRVPAMLSDGEYVIDATTVADLGDGNSELGARKLDKIRGNIAAHKGRKKRVPPKAKSSVLSYMRGI